MVSAKSWYYQLGGVGQYQTERERAMGAHGEVHFFVAAATTTKTYTGFKVVFFFAMQQGIRQGRSRRSGTQQHDNDQISPNAYSSRFLLGGILDVDARFFGVRVVLVFVVIGPVIGLAFDKGVDNEFGIADRKEKTLPRQSVRVTASHHGLTVWWLCGCVVVWIGCGWFVLPTATSDTFAAPVTAAASMV